MQIQITTLIYGVRESKTLQILLSAPDNTEVSILDSSGCSHIDTFNVVDLSIQVQPKDTNLPWRLC